MGGIKKCAQNCGRKKEGETICKTWARLNSKKWDGSMWTERGLEMWTECELYVD